MDSKVLKYYTLIESNSQSLKGRTESELRKIWSEEWCDRLRLNDFLKLVGEVLEGENSFLIEGYEARVVEPMHNRLIREIQGHPCKEAFVFAADEIEYVRGCDRFEILRTTPEGYLYITWKED